MRKKDALNLLVGMRNCLPDRVEGYRDISDGRWAIGDHVYPVARPPRGEIVILPAGPCGACRGRGVRQS